MEECKRAAIYCRISLDKRKGKRGEGEGVQRQERECRELCRFQNYEITEIYVDNSISAHGTATKKSKERPEYNRMIEDYKNGKFDVIVAWKLDRISRSNDEINQLIKAVGRKGVYICTTDVGEQSLNDSTAQFLLQITSSIAQWESSRKSERTKAMFADRASRGVFRVGPNRAYGYDHYNNIIPEEAAIVKLIYEAYDRGSSINAISRALAGDDDGTLPNFPTAIPTRVADAIKEGKTPPDIKWSSRSTANILRNPKYAGYMVHNPTEDGKHNSYDSHWKEHIVRDEDGEIVRTINVEPIIAEDLWWRVQDRRDQNLTDSHGNLITGRGGACRNIGSGLYVCGVCGKPLKTGGRANFKGHDYGMTLYCKGHMSRVASHIDKFVLEVIRKRLALPDLKDILYEPEDHTDRLKEIRSELKTLNGRIAQTEHDYDDDLIDARTRKRKISKLAKQVEELNEERVRLSTDNLTASVINAPDPAEAFSELTDPQQIAQIINFLCTVTVYPHKRGKRITAESLKEEVKIEWKEV